MFAAADETRQIKKRFQEGEEQCTPQLEDLHIGPDAGKTTLSSSSDSGTSPWRDRQ
jgi:hypothetical protein